MKAYVLHDRLEDLRREPAGLGHPDTILIELNVDSGADEHTLKSEVQQLLDSEQRGYPVTDVKVEIGHDAIKTFGQEDMRYFNGTMLDILHQCHYHWNTFDRMKMWVRLTAFTQEP